jgi:hypothetical protein
MSENYTIEINDEGETMEFSKRDMADFHQQRTGYLSRGSILCLGTLRGKGQTGGRYITVLAQKLERAIVADLGIEGYTYAMDLLLGVSE